VNNEQTRVLTFDEQARYLAAATPVLLDVATLMLETGMRPEEVYGIRPENVNLAGGFLLNPYGKTKAARRRVPLKPFRLYDLATPGQRERQSRALIL
jgi:integrase